MTELTEHEHPEPYLVWTNTELEFINARVRDYGRAEYLRGLEDAAKVCEDLYDRQFINDSDKALDCAEAIRALKE
jgi:hypothetical protein